jgi:hypothetical protein
MDERKLNSLVPFGGLAVIILANFRPMALRPRLLPGLPLSIDGFILNLAIVYLFSGGESHVPPYNHLTTLTNFLRAVR